MLPSNWWYWVDVMIPKERDTDKAFLFIGGGSAAYEAWELNSMTLKKAVSTKSVITQVSNITYQPLRFGYIFRVDRDEDDLIAYGLSQFLSNGATEDEAQ